jgi:hypothetical protein
MRAGAAMSESISANGLRFDTKPHGVEIVREISPTQDEVLGTVSWGVIEQVRAARPITSRSGGR